MRIDIVTVFPEFFNEFVKTSIIWKAINYQFLELNIVNLRDFSHNKHKKIDDTPYGGGSGMLIQFPPLYDCIQSLKTENSAVILLSPQGKIFTQTRAKKMAKHNHLIIICGHYEGVDSRIEQFIDYEISIGNYILTGGEIPAMIVTDAITRLIPGVIKEESVTTDSLENNLLKYAQYTKPASYKGYDIPEILTSGNHALINKWRYESQLTRTKEKRKDLYNKHLKNNKS